MQDLNTSLLHMGAWCKNFPQSPYGISPETRHTSPSYPYRELWGFKGPQLSLLAHTASNGGSTNAQKEAEHDLHASLQTEPRNRNTGSKDLTPMRRWLREISEEGPWLALESPLRNYSSRRMNYSAIDCDTDTTMSDTTATVEGPRTENSISRRVGMALIVNNRLGG
jgi:hypothetical protein